MDWGVRLLAAGVLVLLSTLGVVTSLEVVAHNQEELIAGIKNLQVSVIVLEQDINLHTEHWQGELRGHGALSPSSNSGTAPYSP